MSDLRIIIAAGHTRQTYADELLLADQLDDIHDKCFGGQGTTLIPVILPPGVIDMTVRLADNRGWATQIYTYDYAQHPENGAQLSNQNIIDHKADLLLALPDQISDGPSPGTWDMIRRAVAAGIETRIYPEASHE